MMADGDVTDDVEFSDGADDFWPFPVGVPYMAAADRQRAFRARQREGKSVIPVEIDHAIIRWLIETGRISENLADRPAALAQAILGIVRVVQASEKIP